MLDGEQEIIEQFHSVFDDVARDIARLQSEPMESADYAILWASCQERNELCKAILALAEGAV